MILNRQTFSSEGGLPIGTVIQCEQNPGDGWIECDGSLIDIDQYPDANLPQVFTGSFLETSTINDIYVDKVVSNGNIAVAYDYDSYVFMYSTDGINWINTGHRPGSGQIRHLVYDGEYFYSMIGYATSSYSTYVSISKDGINWSTVSKSKTAVSNVVADTANGGVWFMANYYLCYMDHTATITQVTQLTSEQYYTFYYNNGSLIIYSGASNSTLHTYDYSEYSIIDGIPTYKTKFTSRKQLHVENDNDYKHVAYDNKLISIYQTFFDLSSLQSGDLYYDYAYLGHSNCSCTIINGLVYDSNHSSGGETSVSQDGIHYKALPNVTIPLAPEKIFQIGDDWYYIQGSQISKLQFDKKLLPYKPGHYIKVV